MYIFIQKIINMLNLISIFQRIKVTCYLCTIGEIKIRPARCVTDNNPTELLLSLNF